MNPTESYPFTLEQEESILHSTRISKGIFFICAVCLTVSPAFPLGLIMLWFVFRNPELKTKFYVTQKRLICVEHRIAQRDENRIKVHSIPLNEIITIKGPFEFTITFDADILNRLLLRACPIEIEWGESNKKHLLIENVKHAKRFIAFVKKQQKKLAGESVP